MKKLQLKKNYLKKNHTFEVKECGFFINTSMPYMGASPDSLEKNEVGSAVPLYC